MYLGYNWLIIQKTLPINAFFVNSKQWLQVMFMHLSKLLFGTNNIIIIIPLIFIYLSSED